MSKSYGSAATVMVAASLLAVPTSAGALTVNAGAPQVFDFHLTPPPGNSLSYDQLLFAAGLDTSTLDQTPPDTDEGFWQLCTELGGGGSCLSPGDGVNWVSWYVSPSDNAPGFMDGVFSALLTVTSGSVDVSPLAQGQWLDWQTYVIARTAFTGPDQAGSVPEAPLAALLGIGAFALAVSGRRSKAPKS